MSVQAASAARPRRTPPWRNVRVLRVAFQVAFLVAVGALVLYLLENLLGNLRRLGIERSFDYLDQPAGFAIPDSDFRSTQDLLAAVLVGARNTLVVSLVGIALALLLGLVVGVARLSPNWLLRRLAAIYVETLRNVPVLVIIIFLYLAVFLRLPTIGRAIDWGGVLVWSNRGLVVPWVQRTGDTAVFLAALAIGAAGAVAVGVWRTRRFDATGEPHHRVLWSAGVRDQGPAAREPVPQPHEELVAGDRDRVRGGDAHHAHLDRAGGAGPAGDRRAHGRLPRLLA